MLENLIKWHFHAMGPLKTLSHFSFAFCFYCLKCMYVWWIVACFLDTSEYQISELNLEHYHGKIQEAKLPSIHSTRQRVYMILIGNFTLVVNTKVRGSDHRGDFRIAQRRDQVQFKYTEWSGLGCKTVKGIYKTNKSVDWPQYQTSRLQLQCKCNESFRLERTGGISRSKENV